MVLPEILVPRSGSLGLQNWEKVWAIAPEDDVFALRAISAEGAIVVVRPDQYVAHVLSLDSRDALTEFFERFLVE